MHFKFQPRADPPMTEIQNSKFKIQNPRKGFSLIELIVTMFIFAILMGGMVAVSVAGFRSYGKSKAVKTVTEDVGFAINSITKDVRMGKVENPSAGFSNGSLKQYLMISRNRGGKICYYLDRTAGSSYVGVIEGVASSAIACPNPSSSVYSKILNLSGTGMDLSSTSGFYACPTDTSITESPCLSTVAEKGRGWAEINLNIESPGMDTDSIRLQTIVSSRDYGWEETP